MENTIPKNGLSKLRKTLIAFFSHFTSNDTIFGMSGAGAGQTSPAPLKTLSLAAVCASAGGAGGGGGPRKPGPTSFLWWFTGGPKAKGFEWI